MARSVDLSAFDKVRSLADYDKAAIEEARQRFMQAQALQMQQKAADRQQQMFDLERQKFEAEKAQPDQMFGGNSFQAQLGNQMKRMGYSDDQIIQALTMKGIPLQDGGYATYSPSSIVGSPRGTPEAPPEPLSTPRNPSARSPVPAGDMGATNERLPLPTPDDLRNQVDDLLSGRGGTHILVQPGMKQTEIADRMAGIAKTESQGQNALDVINALIDEQGNLRPEAQSSVGGPSGIQGRIASAYPITQDQRRTQPFIDQLKGQAFLQAFDQLKGGGQITEIEGRKATEAITRLQQYQSEEDFAKALSDLRDIVNKGMERARQQGAYINPAMPMASQPQNVQQSPAQQHSGGVVRWEDLP